MSGNASSEKAKKIENEARTIMEKLLPSLPYYNDTNYKNNIKTLRRIITVGNKNIMNVRDDCNL